MSFETAVDHFFGSIFGAKKGSLIQLVLSDASSFVALAEPIVNDIENNLKPVVWAGGKPAAVVAAIEKFLAKYEPDATKAAAAAAQLSVLPVADLLHDAALFALQTLAPGGSAAANLLSLAIELAYAMLKKSAPVPVGAT